MASFARKLYDYWTSEPKKQEMASGEPVSDDTGVDQIDGIFDSLSLDNDAYVYKMNHRKRGKFIIINNKVFRPNTGMNERSGTDEDAGNLFRTFKKLGFEVSLVNNLTRDQMLDKMIEASKVDHSDCDCFAMAVLSHGDSEVIYGVDDIISIDNLVAPIKTCKTLVGKPKLFFFQACRGNELDSGIQADAVGESRPNLTIPLEADMLYAYSTVPGYFSWRNSSKGSWFVQALTQVLSKPESDQMEFVRVLTRVSHAVAYQFESNASRPEMNRKKQVPSIVSMLTKDLYLKLK